MELGLSLRASAKHLGLDERKLSRYIATLRRSPLFAYDVRVGLTPEQLVMIERFDVVMSHGKKRRYTEALELLEEQIENELQATI